MNLSSKLFFVIISVLPMILSTHIKAYTKPFESFGVMEFHITCGSSSKKLANEPSKEEVKEIVEFVEAAMMHSNSLVYLSFRIDKECASCGCPRADHSNHIDRPVESYKVGTITIDQRSSKVRVKRFSGGPGVPLMYTEGLEVKVYLPGHWAVPYLIFFPRYHHLTNMQYHLQEYGSYLVYSGLFTARFNGETGVNVIHFDVVDPSLEEFAALESIRGQIFEDR